MPSRPNPHRIRLALIAYTADGEVQQLVSLGTMAKPLPVARLLANVRRRIVGADVGQVLRFTPKR
jgi:hypothetical protein